MAQIGGTLRRIETETSPQEAPRPEEVTVFIDPVSRHFLRNQLFDPGNAANIENAHAPYFYLRDLLNANGVEVHTADYLFSGEKYNKYNVYFSLGMLRDYAELAKRRNLILSAYFTFEAAIVAPSSFRKLREVSRFVKRIYSYTTPEAVARFGCSGLHFHKLHIPYCYNSVFPDLWKREDRKFLTLLNWNRRCRLSWQELYTERIRAVDYFSQFDEIDLYGLAWDRLPDWVGETRVPYTLRRLGRHLQERFPILHSHRYEAGVRRAYRGEAASKFETQSNYTFTICYENMALPGWLNENLFDCFLVGTIPIFLGPPDITDYVPEECFIDKRKFTYPELRSFLKSLTAKQIRNYKEKAREYLSSEQFRPFRKESFAQLFIQAVEEDLGISLHQSLNVEQLTSRNKHD